jgi:hypothetical protein
VQVHPEAFVVKDEAIIHVLSSAMLGDNSNAHTDRFDHFFCQIITNETSLVCIDIGIRISEFR